MRRVVITGIGIYSCLGKNLEFPKKTTVRSEKGRVGTVCELRTYLVSQENQVGHQGWSVVLNDVPERVVISDTYQVSLNVGARLRA